MVCENIVSTGVTVGIAVGCALAAPAIGIVVGLGARAVGYVLEYDAGGNAYNDVAGILRG